VQLSKTKDARTLSTPLQEAKGSAGMILNQVTLTVRDYDEAVAFNTRLGLVQIVRSDHGYARFELSEGATLSIHTDPDAIPVGTMIYFECEDLDARVEQLRKAGLTIDQGPEHKPWLWREARLFDPSGNAICLYSAGSNRRFPPWRLDGATGP